MTITSAKEKVMQVMSMVRKRRNELNFSQDYMANKLSISQNAYSKIEIGLTKVKVQQLMHISALLDISLSN